MVLTRSFRQLTLRVPDVCVQFTKTNLNGKEDFIRKIEAHLDLDFNSYSMIIDFCLLYVYDLSKTFKLTSITENLTGIK